MKAVNGHDVVFTDKRGNILKNMTEAALKRLYVVVIMFGHQHNSQTGQHICIVVDKRYPQVCPVLNMARMALTKVQLGHSLDLPLAIFLHKKWGSQVPHYKKSY